MRAPAACCLSSVPATRPTRMDAGVFPLGSPRALRRLGLASLPSDHAPSTAGVPGACACKALPLALRFGYNLYSL
jgi:hypothetical protein